MGYLGTKPANAAVTSEQIADGAVSTADIAANAVTAAKIADANITQAKIATGVAGTGPAFSAYRTSNQSISSNTFTKIQFSSERFDTNNNFDSTTNYRFTPTIAGYYQITVTYGAGASTGLTRVLCSIFQNGIEYIRGSDIFAVVGNTTTTALIYFNGTTDYVEGYAYIAATTPVITGNSTECQMSGYLVRAA